MVKILERALAEAATLPDAAQEEIGRQLLSHIEKWRDLKSAIDEGIRSLEVEGGRELDMGKLIQELRSSRGHP